MIEKARERGGGRTAVGPSTPANAVAVADGVPPAAPGDQPEGRDALGQGSASGAPAHVHHTPHGEDQQAALVRVAFDLIAERGFEGK